MENTEKKQPLVQVKNLCKYFEISRKETLKAVDDLTFDIYKGETVSLVGESGCGKSTTGRTMIKLYNPTSGNVYYDGKDIFKYNHAEQKEFCKKVQMIFQNPYSSLNPRMTVKDIVGEGLKQHGMSTKDADAKVEQLLATVGLNKDHMSRFPHEFSGGQRQRIGIARALSVDPEFIICDEPISALDVSIQAQVINILEELQDKYSFTYLFISHDLSMVRHISNRIGVMYLGSLVELAESYGATVQGIDTLEETIQLLTAGRIDATLNADVSFYDYLNVHPDANFKLVAQTEEASHVAIPVLKSDDTSFLDALNSAIEALRADGTLKELSEKYFGEDISSEN